MPISIGVSSHGSNPAFGTASSATASSVTSAATGSVFAICVNAKSQNITSVTDSFSNTYTLKQTGTGFNKGYLYVCDGGNGGSGHTATVNLAAADSVTIHFAEILGAASPSYDAGGNAGNTSGGTSLTGASVTTTNANDLILSFFAGYGDSGAVSSAGAGFSMFDSIPGGGIASSGMSSRVVSATGTYSDTYTIASFEYAAFAIASFKQASGGVAATVGWRSTQPLNPPGNSPSRFGRFNQLPRGYLSTAQTSGSSALTIAQTGALTGTGALAGTSALVVGQTGAVTGAGAMTAASALVVNQTAALTGAGALAGQSGLVFGQTGTLTQPGLVGAASLVFGQSGALSASGVLAGSSALQFAQTAALTGAGAIAGASALTFAQAATLIAAGTLAGSGALTFAQTAALAATGALAGTSAHTFGASGTADLPAGALAGTSALSFGGSAALSAFGELIGNCQIIVDASANTGQVSLQPGPVDSPRIAEGYYRRKKKLRKLERPAEPVFIAPASLERLPQAVIDRVPNFTTLAQTLGEQPALLSARIDSEIAHLMQIADERDDEEALAWILKVID
jgi:hypothetical protein